jgi:hypothetical protein
LTGAKTCDGYVLQKHVDHHFFPRFMSNDTVLKKEHWCLSAERLSALLHPNGGSAVQMLAYFRSM